MSGTLEGGRKASITTREKNGNDFYQRIGAIGGLKSRTGGFGQGELGKARASISGRLGGRISSRSRNKVQPDPKELAKWRKEYERNLKRLQQVHEQARETSNV